MPDSGSFNNSASRIVSFWGRSTCVSGKVSFWGRHLPRQFGLSGASMAIPLGKVPDKKTDLHQIAGRPSPNGWGTFPSHHVGTSEVWMRGFQKGGRRATSNGVSVGTSGSMQNHPLGIPVFLKEIQDGMHIERSGIQRLAVQKPDAMPDISFRRALIVPKTARKDRQGNPAYNM